MSKASTRLALSLIPFLWFGCSGEKTEVNLFSGVDLENWKFFLVDASVAKEDVWRVEDGILICRGEPLGYLYTDQSFTNFRLQLEWRWAPGTEPGNSGVLMRINGEPRAIPRSIEAQLKSGNAGDVYGFRGMALEGDAERRRTGTNELVGDFVGISRKGGTESEPGEWNRYDITLEGTSLWVRMNGELVNEAVDCDQISGPIGLQSEGGEIHFRNVRLTPLD